MGAVLTRQNGGRNVHDLSKSQFLNNATEKSSDDNTAVIEWLCRQLERLEADNNSATEQVQRLLGDKHSKSVEIEVLTKELKGLKSLTMNQKLAHPGHVRGTSKPIENLLDKYAIT